MAMDSGYFRIGDACPSTRYPLHEREQLASVDLPGERRTESTGWVETRDTVEQMGTFCRPIYRDISFRFHLRNEATRKTDSWIFFDQGDFLTP